MSKVKIELDHNGIAAFLCSAPVENMVKGYADRAVQRLGTGHKSYTIVWTRYPKMRRKVAIVKAKTKKAQRANLKDNTLLKAVLGK
ncbi:hypothetical protein FFK04_07550 [Ruminococcus sp. KGMB03662]|nr:hypothetical protein FFK04_07550 [Ruminococcus sp. KGMB03662]